MTWSIVLFATAHAKCGDRAALLEILERQVLEGRLEEAEISSKALIEAFGCGPLADPEQIARLWLAEAVMLAAYGESEASDNALVSTARLSAEAWQDVYGAALRERLEAARRHPEAEHGRLRVEPLHPGYVGAVDGVVVSFPVTLSPGLHLLQVGTDPSSMETAFRFAQPSGFELVIDPKLPPLPAPEPVPVLPSVPDPEPVRLSRAGGARPRRILHALAVGGASALLYGVSFATEAAYYSAPAQARSPGLRTVTNGLVITSAGGGLTSAALLARALATPAGGEAAEGGTP